jgi:hypothetical protein
MKTLTILLSFFTIALFSSATIAQTAEQIDVKFVEISKIGSTGTSRFEMRAVNSSQNSVAYIGVDSAAITGVVPFIHGCEPCSPPKLFSSNVFHNQFTADLGQTSGQVKFYLSSSESSPIYLNQRVLSRKRDFYLNGSTKLTGRIEVTNSSGFVIAVDNNVVLEGGYSVLYGKPYISPSGKKYTYFKSLIYTLNAPEN